MSIARPLASVLAVPLLLALALPATAAATPPPATTVTASGAAAAAPPSDAAASAHPDASAKPGAATETAPARSAPTGPLKVEELPQKYRDWLDDVQYLISEAETRAFLMLHEDYQRDAFIEKFWAVRDPYPDTARNELRDRFEASLEEVKQTFGSLKDDRAKVYLLNGPPAGAVQSPRCSLLWPLEIWVYQGSQQLHETFLVIFYQRWGMGTWKIWYPDRGVLELAQMPDPYTTVPQLLAQISSSCRDGDSIAGAIQRVSNRGPLDYNVTMQKILQRPKGPAGEWLQTFGAFSTDVDPNAPPLPAKMTLAFPARQKNRTVMQAVVTVPRSEAGRAELAGRASYDFLITGEVIVERALFESFRYKFDFPESTSGETLPMVFERLLRPGKYTVVVKVEDTNGHKIARLTQQVEVPRVDAEAPPPPPSDPVTAQVLAEANAAIANGDTTIHIIPPQGDMQLGMVRFDTLTTGHDIDRVSFLLDGKPVLEKRKPPYSVELDLGNLPASHTLRVVATDAAAREVASDELSVNSSPHRFAVRLLSPSPGQRYTRSARAEAQVQVPEGESVERVEFWYDETLVSTLYQEPWAQPIVLPKTEELGYVRAVAYLTDGNSTEDVVFINSPEPIENLNVQFVELYTAVVDGEGHPVEGLTQDDFAVSEDGVPQEIRRFEKVENLPIHAALLLDTSASMETRIAEAQKAAVSFFQQVIHPRDRGALVTFNDRPNLAAKFTNDVQELAGGLAGLKAERGTSLYDSVVFSLFYFNAIRGQRALVVLSDGKDENSRFSLDQALEYARRAGVAIYTVGLDVEERDARKALARFAEETGGRSYLIQQASELQGVYDAIQKELRSRYLLAYQSTNTSKAQKFRTVDVKVKKDSKLEVKTLRGYYP